MALKATIKAQATSDGQHERTTEEAPSSVDLGWLDSLDKEVEARLAPIERLLLTALRAYRDNRDWDD